MRIPNLPLLTTFLVFLVVSGTTASHGQTSPHSLTQVVAASKPSVVFVVAATESGAQSGSGFVFSSNSSSSLIVTANHVTEGATRIDVIFDSNEHERYPAHVITRDHTKDVAVLRVSLGNRVTLGMENSGDVQEGTAIVLIGYPLATLRFERIGGDALRPSVHSGIVSAIRFNGEIIQFDAATYHGDSGAPIIDTANGRVVAIVHGSEIDPSYAAQGLEKDLPGSSFGPSSKVIAEIANKAAVAALPSAAESAPSTSDDQSSPRPSALADRETSASYRVGYGVPQETVSSGSYDLGTEINQAVESSALDRLVTFLKSDNSLYLIPVQLTTASLQDSERLSGYCDDQRLNTIITPSYSWNLTGGPRYNAYGLVGYQGTATVVVDLYAFDCFGIPFFVERKTKTENRYFAHRAPDREIVDMANDLLDHLMSDFAMTRDAHIGTWTNLLKTGISIDPSDQRYHSMMFFAKTPEGYKVKVVVPRGPADQAGVRVDDTIMRINSIDATGLGLQEVLDHMNTPDYNLDLQRPGGPVTVTVHPARYAEIVKLFQR